MPIKQGTLPYVRKSAAQTVPGPLESAIQVRAVQLLMALGYRVQETQHQYRLQTCPACSHQFRPTGGYGTTKGIADVLVYCDRWPDTAPLMLCLEMKGEKTPLSPEQQELYERGRIIIARSEREAVEGIQAAERMVFGRVYGGDVEDWDAVPLHVRMPGANQTPSR